MGSTEMVGRKLRPNNRAVQCPEIQSASSQYSREIRKWSKSDSLFLALCSSSIRLGSSLYENCYFVHKLLSLHFLLPQRDSSYSRLGSAMECPRMTPSVNKEWTPTYNLQGGNQHYNHGSSAYHDAGMKSETMEASRMTTSSRDEAHESVSNASDIESEWIEEDEPGVNITIRQFPDGTRELRRVRFR